MTSDPTRGRIESGFLVAQPDATTGTLTVTATSLRQPPVTGSATFTILTKGQAEVVVEPCRTQSLRIVVEDSLGQRLNSTVIVRQAGRSTDATASIQLPAGSGYHIEAAAFEAANPGDGAEPIARGRRGERHDPQEPHRAGPDHALRALRSLHRKTRSRSWPARHPRDRERLAFGASQDLDLTLYLGSLAIAATRVSDQVFTIEATDLPDGTTGNLVVSVDGVPSTSLALFTVGHTGLDVTMLSGEVPETGLGLLFNLGAPGQDTGMGLSLSGQGDTEANTGIGLSLAGQLAQTQVSGLDLTVQPDTAPASGSGFDIALD